MDSVLKRTLFFYISAVHREHGGKCVLLDAMLLLFQTTMVNIYIHTA